eukprot:g59117.t1
MITLAKGNRSKQVTQACKKYGGFYLGSIGGPAAILAQDNIKKVEVLEYPELGMEAVWKIEVVDFPAFIVVDDKGSEDCTSPAQDGAYLLAASTCVWSYASHEELGPSTRHLCVLAKKAAEVPEMPSTQPERS